GHATQSQDPSELTIAPDRAMTNRVRQVGGGKAAGILSRINEACAAVTPPARQEPGRDHARAPLCAGARAQGPPVGWTGSRLIVTLINALQKTGGKRGVASLCIGGGQATAVAIELL